MKKKRVKSWVIPTNSECFLPGFPVTFHPFLQGSLEDMILPVYPRWASSLTYPD